MATCRCCGQPIKVRAAKPAELARPAERIGFTDADGGGDAAGAIDAVWVDDALMACCNAAYEAAAARGAGQVEIAHFLFAAARMDSARGWFASSGISTQRLGGALVGEMRRRRAAAAPARGGGVGTSSQLQALIYRSQEDALRRGLSSISIADVLRVLAAQADALGIGERLSAWFAVSGVGRRGDAGNEQMSRPVSEFAPLGAHVRVADRVLPVKQPARGRSGLPSDRPRASRVAEDVARDAAGADLARRHAPPASRAAAPVRHVDEHHLMRLEARLAEQDRALRAMSEQLARVEAAARAEAVSNVAGVGVISRTQRGYRASASRWRQRRRGGQGAGRGRGVGAGTGPWGGDGSGFGNPLPQIGARGAESSGTAGGSGKTSTGSSGNGSRQASCATTGTGSGTATGKCTGKSTGKSTGRTSAKGAGNGAGSRKSRTRKSSGHGPRERYGRMQRLRRRLSSQRNSRRSGERTHERDTRLPRERATWAGVGEMRRDPVAWVPDAKREPREERETTSASTGLSWARAPWPEQSARPQVSHEPRNVQPAPDEDGDDDDGEAREKRFYLALDDDVVAAPSIGPRTAGRLIPNGIVTVRDLLGCDADDLAARVTARHITADRIRAWQAQARLVCTIPWLRGTHAQLLVGAGYLAAAEIVADTPDGVCAAILAFAATREGQSVLRSGEPPQMERLLKWVQHAGLAEPARAELAA